MDLADGAAHDVDGAASHCRCRRRGSSARAACRAAPGGIDPPRRAVVTLDRDELVVAERHGEQSSGAGSARSALAWRNWGMNRSTSPTWLTTPAASTSRGHRRGDVAVDGERLLAEDARPRSAAARDQASCSEVHVVTKTASTRSRTSSSPTASAPTRSAKAAGAIGRRVVHGDDAMIAPSSASGTSCACG